MNAAVFRALICVVFGLSVMAFVRVSFAQVLSPGPLSGPHASLEGDKHCNDCHSSGRRVDQAGCLKCHADLGARISAGQGLHGREYKGKACEGCHVEHLGEGLVRWPGGDPSKLDHALTGWALNGAHKNLTCNKCHNKINARGDATFLGLSTACTSCHQEPHQGRFGQICTNCHDERAWKEVNLKTFNHNLARFALRGAHQTVPCAKCHFDPPKYTGLKFDRCTSCHRDPHAGKLGPSCTDCHEDTRWKPVTFKHGGAKHPGTSLANGHASVACATCHDRGNLVAPSRGSECVSCHKPTHKAPFGRACATCHASIQWLGLPTSIGLASHVKTNFQLIGKHQGVDCAGCHKLAMPREQRYRKLPYGRCIGCHADQHRGEFAVDDHGECKPCHTPFGYRPTLFDAVAHLSTRFPLVGKHTATMCSACHTTPRPRFDLHVAKQACADCHQNPHGDQFAKEMSQGGCAHCHESTGWKLPKIDHSTWPLTGAHATAQCESCHHPTPEDRKAGHGSSYRGVPRHCGGCHDDKHAGQFRLTPPVMECAGCHTTKSFKISNFDHQAKTGWALTGAHAPLECSKCHRSAALNDGNATVRWRLPSHECQFCHANPHEPRGGS
jgi:hypothetical protein